MDFKELMDRKYCPLCGERLDEFAEKGGKVCFACGYTHITPKKKIMRFEVSVEETEAYLKWKEEHDKVCPLKSPGKQGAIGGRTTFTFTGTSLGELFGVQCGCGAEECFTDVSHW